MTSPVQNADSKGISDSKRQHLGSLDKIVDYLLLSHACRSTSFQCLSSSGARDINRTSNSVDEQLTHPLQLATYLTITDISV